MNHACQRCESPLEATDLRCAICGLPSPVLPTSEAGPATTVARVHRCHGCGAAVAYDERVGAPRCAFCRTVMEVEVPEDPIETAQAYLPFAVQAEPARAALRQWLGSRGWFRPRDLQAKAVLSRLQPLWWAGWVIDAEVLVHWAADSNAGARRSAWAPHAGRRALTLRGAVVSASRGLTGAEVAALAGRYHLESGTAEPQGPEGATIEQFAVQRSGARQMIAAGLRHIADQAIRDDIPGTQVRKVRTAVLPQRLHTRRLAFPAWVLAYHYGGRLYRAIVHGQDPGCVHGESPLAWGKIAAIVIAAIAVALLLIALLSR
jgi:hypothetical protein